MSMSDPIADMLTRIRNAIAVQNLKVEFPYSNLKECILKIIARHHYIYQYNIVNVKKDSPLKKIVVKLRYHLQQPAITNLQRISKPGLRVYVNKDNIPYVLNGRGLAILSTSKGLVSDKEARDRNLGGELIMKIW